MGARTTGDYPRTLVGFYRRFPDDAACFDYLVETRWPGGFRCPRCGSGDAILLTERRTFACRSCRQHTSATSGTTLHKSKVPLHAWFQAAWLMTSLAPGISALALSRQLGLRFATTWLLLHKLRRATVNPEREPLRGDIAMDDAWIGGVQAGLKGGHQRVGRTAIQVAVAVERRSDTSLGRVRMGVISNDDAKTLGRFVTTSIAPGSFVFSDAHRGYPAALADGYSHRPLSPRAMKRQTGKHTSAAPGVDRVISNLKTWLKGTHHGVGADHLDAYLDEFVFRFNRRHNRAAGFASLLGLTTEVGHATAAAISPSRRLRSAGAAPWGRRAWSIATRHRWPMARWRGGGGQLDRTSATGSIPGAGGRQASPPSATRTGRVCAQSRRRPGRARRGRRPEATNWRPQRRWSASGPGGLGIPTRSSDRGR